MPYGPPLEQPECAEAIWWEENDGREFWCEGCGRDHSDWALESHGMGEVWIRCRRCGNQNHIDHATEQGDRAYHAQF